MGFSRFFHTKYDFVFTNCYGVVDDSSLRIHLLSYKIDARGLKNIKEIADARGIGNVDKATVRGLIELAELDRKQSAGREEFLAIVATKPLIREIASMYASQLKESKNDIGIFYDVGKALSWLGYNEQDATILRKFMNKHRA